MLLPFHCKSDEWLRYVNFIFRNKFYRFIIRPFRYLFFRILLHKWINHLIVSWFNHIWHPFLSIFWSYRNRISIMQILIMNLTWIILLILPISCLTIVNLLYIIFVKSWQKLLLYGFFYILIHLTHHWW